MSYRRFRGFPPIKYKLEIKNELRIAQNDNFVVLLAWNTGLKPAQEKKLKL